jgi:hypothetical protein
MSNLTRRAELFGARIAGFNAFAVVDRAKRPAPRVGVRIGGKLAMASSPRRVL